MATSEVSLAMGDSELVTAAQHGDRAAFAALVERYQGLVFGYLRARVLQASDAEDLAQEVFLRSYARRHASIAPPWSALG